MTQPSRLPLATLALFVATLAWGGSFTWAKAAGDALNQALGLSANATLGPLLLLTWRYAMSALLWFVLFPAARRGWTVRGCSRVARLGLLLWAGQAIQMLGLDRTSEAVSAFLTSLAMVFVPVIMATVLRRPPATVMWAGVALALGGIWLMTGAAPSGFGVGEMFGLLCAVIFSVHMITLGEVGQHESSWRLALGQFGIVAIATGLTCLAVEPVPALFAPSTQWAVLTHPTVWPGLLQLVVFSTMGAFGLMFHFQPRLDPTRAALIYLAEPVFAAGYAYLTVGSMLSPIALFGASLLLLANVVVELRGNHCRRDPVHHKNRQSS